MVLLYLVSKPWSDDFRTFLVGHTALLSVAQLWTLRALFPQTLRRAVVAYEAAAREELASPLDTPTMRELQHYFFHRHRGTDLKRFRTARRPEESAEHGRARKETLIIPT